MKLSLNFVVSTFGLSTLFLGGSWAQDDYVRGNDPHADAIRDIQLGMAGMKQAAQDPVLLAQLVQDLQVRLQSSRI